MINITENSHENLYYNVDDCVEFCKKIQNSKLSNHVDYHIFWNVGKSFERKQTLTIKSYLCTQDLEKTTLNVWSNVDLMENEFLKPFLPYIKFRIWEPLKEAENTEIQGRRKILTTNDNRNWAAGDLFRILCLHNYGGLYVDFDVVFLRDLSPLLDQEFMYKWSFQKNMINGAVMRLFKESQLCKDLLSEISNSPAMPGTTAWSTDLYQKVREYNKNWTIFPCAFFNTEWQIFLTPEQKKDVKNQELVKFIMYPFKKTELSDKLYEGVFTWHWHNGWDENIENGSKWQIFEEKFNEEIKKKFNI
jgi:hypothetical protein